MKKLLPRDPDSIGGFELIGRLGAGGLGVVYLASRDGVYVALKVMREALVDDPTERERFRREVEVLGKVKSKNVARIIDSGVDDETAWFATEFVNGPNLKEHLDTHGSMHGEEWLTLAEGLLNGLADIHQQGIVHRDIKPANIILENGHPKIIDFGISQMAEATSLTTTGMVAGSPAWFAPEQIDGREITPATDLFTAGSVLTYAATGKTPWGDPDTMTRASALRIGVGKPDFGNLNAEQQSWVEPLVRPEPSARKTPERRVQATDQFRTSSEERSKRSERRALGAAALGVGIGLAALLTVFDLATDPNPPIVDSESADSPDNSLAEQSPTTNADSPSTDARVFEVHALLPQANDYPYGITYLPPMEAKADELGINLTIANSEYDADKQARDCEAAVAAEADGIILWPAVANSMRPCLEAANKQGIPVWVSVADVSPDDADLTHGYSGLDSYAQAAVSAEMMCELADGAKIGIIQVNGMRGNSVASLRQAGFIEHIEANCRNVSIMAEGWGNWNREESQIAASEMLTMVGEEMVQGIHAADDTMVAGAIDAARARGMDVESLFITSIGNSFLGNPLVQSGELDGTVFHSSSWDGENAVVGIHRAMTGDTQLGRDDEGSLMYMPNPKVTVDNASDPGFAPEW